MTGAPCGNASAARRILADSKLERAFVDRDGPRFDLCGAPRFLLLVHRRVAALEQTLRCLVGIELDDAGTEIDGADRPEPIAVRAERADPLDHGLGLLFRARRQKQGEFVAAEAKATIDMDSDRTAWPAPSLMRLNSSMSRYTTVSGLRERRARAHSTSRADSNARRLKRPVKP
jgi:hypothetical protein